MRKHPLQIGDDANAGIKKTHHNVPGPDGDLSGDMVV